MVADSIRKRLSGSALLQKTLANTSWLMFGSVLRMVVGLFVGVWVARYLGPDRFGVLSYAVAFVALFSAFANLGLDNIAIRNLVRDQSRKDELLATVFVLKLAGGAVGFTAILATITAVRPDDQLTHWMVAIIAAGMAFQPFDAIDYWFKSQVQSKYTVIAKSSAFLLLSIVKIVCVLNGAPLIAFAWVALAEIALGSVGLLIAYRYVGCTLLLFRSSLAMAMELLKDSWPLIFSGLVSMIYARIDQVMLGEISGNTELGIYSVAVRLAEMWYFIPVALCTSIFPAIVKARAEGDSVFYGRLQRFYRLIAFIGLTTAIVMTVLAQPVVDLLFGESFKDSGPILTVLLWAGLFVGLGIARSSFLMSMNWTKVHLMTVAIGSVANVLLNLYLIPKYGGMGAAVATLVSYWLAVHGLCYFYRPLFQTGNMLTKALIFPKFW